MPLDILPMLKLSITAGITFLIASWGFYFWFLHDKRKHSDDARRLHEVAKKLGVSETQAVHVAVKRLHHELFQ